MQACDARRLSLNDCAKTDYFGTLANSESCSRNERVIYWGRIENQREFCLEGDAGLYLLRPRRKCYPRILFHKHIAGCDNCPSLCWVAHDKMGAIRAV